MPVNDEALRKLKTEVFGRLDEAQNILLAYQTLVQRIEAHRDACLHVWFDLDRLIKSAEQEVQ